MNIHPLFVHFPIGLLVLYAILEILPLTRWYPQAPWNAIKTILVVVGALGAVIASGTGELAEKLLEDKSLKGLIEVHSSFAVISTFIFGTLAYSHFIRWISQHHHIFEGRLRPLSFLGYIADIIAKRWIQVMLALIGLTAITITGALGAAIVYGPDADPIVKIIYSLFF
ncbi:MAG: hypothetical protein NUV61_03350 [Candidatus Azambacteria bacterium]|nr:hypothetical protein [Candidatus Azambacteria bacterium]